MADIKQTGFHPATNSQTLEPILEAPVTRGTVGDAELLRVSVEVARRFPRDETAIMRTLLATIETFSQFAEKAIYSIPYKDNRSGRTVNVEGLSVRAAETIAGEWGHFWVTASIVGETDDFVDVQATAFDCQKNTVARLPFRVSRYEKQREGGFRMLDDRRMLQALQSGISKARRNVVMAVLPMHVKEAFNKAVREALAGGELSKPAIPDKVALCIETYQTDFSVSLAQLESHIGKPRQLWIGRDLSDLRTLYNALKEGETTVAEAFPSDEAPAAPAMPQGTVVKAEEGHLGTAAPQGVVAQTPPQETEADRLRREVSELQARLAMATAPEAPPIPPPPPAPAAPAAPPARPVAVPKVVAPPPAQVTPTAPTAPPAGEDAAYAALSAEVEAAPTIQALDAILGRLYSPGGALQGAPRERKRVILAIVGARRDVLQAG